MIVIIRLDIEEGMKLYKELSAQHRYAHLSVHISALTALQKHIDSLLNKCDVASSPVAAVTAREQRGDKSAGERQHLSSCAKYW